MYSDIALDAAVRGIAELVDSVSIHSADPGPGGIGEIVLSGRAAVTLGAIEHGVARGDRPAEFIVPAHTIVGGWAAWDRRGELLLSEPIDPPEEFVRQGTIEVDVFVSVVDKLTAARSTRG